MICIIQITISRSLLKRNRVLSAYHLSSLFGSSEDFEGEQASEGYDRGGDQLCGTARGGRCGERGERAKRNSFREPVGSGVRLANHSHLDGDNNVGVVKFDVAESFFILNLH